MIVSNRLITAALHALSDRLAAEYDKATKSGLSGSVCAEYAREVNNLRFALSAYGEELTLSTAKIRLPGEEA